MGSDWRELRCRLGPCLPFLLCFSPYASSVIGAEPIARARVLSIEDRWPVNEQDEWELGEPGNRVIGRRACVAGLPLVRTHTRTRVHTLRRSGERSFCQFLESRRSARRREEIVTRRAATHENVKGDSGFIIKRSRERDVPQRELLRCCRPIPGETTKSCRSRDRICVHARRCPALNPFERSLGWERRASPKSGPLLFFGGYCISESRASLAKC